MVKTPNRNYSITATKDEGGHVLTYIVYSNVHPRGIIGEFNTLKEARAYVRRK